MDYTPWAATLGKPLAQVLDAADAHLPRLASAAALILGWILAHVVRTWSARLVVRVARMADRTRVGHAFQRIGLERWR
jgi:hypothetical protein